MEKFSITEDGLVRDEAIREMVERLTQLFPWIDSVTTEANLTFAKAYGTVYASTTPNLFERGLSPSRFNALRYLYLAERRRLSMGELKAKLGVSMPLVTKIVDSLAREGWVERTPGATDRRVVYAQLTDRGAARLEERLPVVHEKVAQNWAGLDDEEKLLLVHLLNKLRLARLARYPATAEKVSGSETGG